MLLDPLHFAEIYAAAVYDKNIEAFVQHYAPEVRIFDAWGQWEAQGLDALRSSTAEWFISLGTERVVVTCNDMQTSQSDSLCVLHAFISYQAVNAEGEPLRAMRERITWILEKRSEGWLVTHQHTSLPLDFRTGQGMKS